MEMQTSFDTKIAGKAIAVKMIGDFLVLVLSFVRPSLASIIFIPLFILIILFDFALSIGVSKGQKGSLRFAEILTIIQIVITGVIFGLIVWGLPLYWFNEAEKHKSQQELSTNFGFGDQPLDIKVVSGGIDPQPATSVVSKTIPNSDNNGVKTVEPDENLETIKPNVE